MIKQIFKTYLRVLRDPELIIAKPSRVSFRNIFLESSVKLTLHPNCIIRGSLHLQKPGAEMTIGEFSFIGSGTQIVSTKHLEIGKNVLVSHGCYITTTDGHSMVREERSQDIPNRWKGFKNWDVVECDDVKICDEVWIGPKSVILKGVHIGEGSVIAAGSVVVSDVESNSLYGGVPAKKIRSL